MADAPTPPAIGPKKASEAERARLRRNQRNSRARKQAYVESLEDRWNRCLREGAHATAELQLEARRVYEENLVLRALLRERGVDDAYLARVLNRADGGPPKINLTGTRPCCADDECGPVAAADDAGGAALASSPTAVGLPQPTQSDYTQPPWDVNRWIHDLSEIKDAYGNKIEGDASPTIPTMAGHVPFDALNGHDHASIDHGGSSHAADHAVSFPPQNTFSEADINTYTSANWS